MARPPRVSPLIPDDDILVYFVTVCVAHRRTILACAEVDRGVRETFDAMDRWQVLVWVLMPDHFHGLVAPMDRRQSISTWSRWFKYGVNERISPKISWQSGCFDRIIRSEESLGEKGAYIWENPVRAGLVTSAEMWPWKGGLQVG
jgi:REP element-mobilizing transposase RayT